MEKQPLYLNKYLSNLAFFTFFAVLLHLLPQSLHLEAKELNEKTVDFSLKTIDGTDIRLQDYRGKKIVHLVFWATWCPHCLMEMPKVKEIHHTLDSNAYEILAIDVGINDTLKRIRKIQKKYEIPCKILLDKRGM